MVALSAAAAALIALAALPGTAAAATATSTCTPAAPAPDPTQPPPAAAVVSYPAPSATGITRTAVTLRATVDTGGLPGQVAFELGDATTGLRCTALQQLTATIGPQPLTAQLTNEKPGTTVSYRAVVTTAAGQVVGADQSFTTVARIARFAPGSTMLGLRVGYLTAPEAEKKLVRWFARPVKFSYHGKRWQVRPARLGATADVAGAVSRALASTGSSAAPVPVAVTVDPVKLDRYVDYLDRLFARPAEAGSVKRVGRKAVVVDAQTAIAIQHRRLEAMINRVLRSTKRPPIEVPVTVTKPKGAGQLSLVVRLGEQSLTLYRDGAVVLTAPVTTGRPALPTPVGSYDIAWRRTNYTFVSPWPEGSPYHYDPVTVQMAMYFFDNDFFHDSSEPSWAYGKGSNLGPYASHGCVHVPLDIMHVLYSTVPDHTPVYVVDS